MKSLRWWMIALLMIGSIINYLTRSTGAFVGVACQDMSGARCSADFDWFEYVERPYRV